MEKEQLLRRLTAIEELAMEEGASPRLLEGLSALILAIAWADQPPGSAARCGDCGSDECYCYLEGEQIL